MGVPPITGGPGTAGRPSGNVPAAAAKSGAAVGETAPNAPSANKLELVQMQGGERMIDMEFYDLGFDHLIRFLSKAANITIIQDPALGDAKVTVIAPEKVTLEAAFQILSAILQARDCYMVKAGPSLYRIEGGPRATHDGGIPFNSGKDPSELPLSAMLVTQVIPLTNLSAQEIAGQVTQMLTQGMVAVPLQSTNSLLITDTAANINKVLQVIQHLEGRLSEGMKSIHCRYRDAAEIAGLVQTMVLSRGGGGGGAAPRPIWERAAATPGAPGAQQRPAMQTPTITSAGGEFVYPDYRTNTLFLHVTREHFEEIQDLVAQLDTRMNLQDSVYVYPVQNMSAGDLAALVAPCVGAQVTVVNPGGTAGQARPGTTGTQPGNRFGGTRGGGAFGGTYNPFQQRPYGVGTPAPPQVGTSAPNAVEVDPLAAPTSEARSGALTLAQAPGMPPPQLVAPAPPAPSGEGMAGGDEGAYAPSSAGMTATITADPTANTLLIMASPEQLEMLKAILEKLDVMPPQVYIEAIIAEVTLTKDNSLGFQWKGLTSQYTLHSGEVLNGTFSTNVGVGTGGSGLTGVIVGPGDFQAILNALAADSNAKVLSRPSIFTENNQQATIQVGQTIPIPTNSTTSTQNGITTTSNAINQQPVGIQLDVTPRVTSGDVVQMVVSVQANDVGPSMNVAGLSYPTTLNREAQSSVSIASGHTVVLGGLMRDMVTSSKTGVPILSQIPLVGALFRSSTTHKDKTELLVFLTPRVVRGASEAQKLSEAERNKLSSIPPILCRPLDAQGLAASEGRSAPQTTR